MALFAKQFSSHSNMQITQVYLQHGDFCLWEMMGPWGGVRRDS